MASLPGVTQCSAERVSGALFGRIPCSTTRRVAMLGVGSAVKGKIFEAVLVWILGGTERSELITFTFQPRDPEPVCTARACSKLGQPPFFLPGEQGEEREAEKKKKEVPSVVNVHKLSNGVVHFAVNGCFE